ncbi:hypothetical protein [Aliarcobacter skirrowii]|uniref:hypothetical protein n=1 Tax=Aliarcobacter skirrowii TaxID=28200 RepID=UPI0029A46603|nr:hypothetical protein [Aliarcobacter skirrowii]MDX4037839.1 hypothetical protein [Aliarcobacter skirrowii]
MIKNMKIKKNIFIVGTPLQVINAIEAIHHFKLKNIVFVIKFNFIQNNIIQIEEQIQAIDKKSEIITIYPSSKGSKFKHYIQTLKYLQKYEYDKFFIGELCSFCRIIIASLKKEKVYFIDDGTATIVHFERDIKSNNINKFGMREFRFLLYGFKTQIKDKLNFFTYYDLEKLPDVEVIKNNLEYMKKDFVLNNIDYGSTIFILGQPIEIFLDENELAINLNKISKKFIDKEILYIPHRAQTKKEIENIRLISGNIDILEINMPVERYFLDNGIYPKHVISFISTALTTTKILFPKCNVNYIKIQKPNLSLSDMNYVDFIYFYFEKDDITEIEI